MLYAIQTTVCVQHKDLERIKQRMTGYLRYLSKIACFCCSDWFYSRLSIFNLLFQLIYFSYYALLVFEIRQRDRDACNTVNRCSFST